MRYGVQGTAEGDRTVKMATGDSSGGMYTISGLSAATVYTVGVCRCDCVSLSTGGVLPLLAQQWHTDLWRVHSGGTGGGEFPRILSEVFWSIECQVKSLSSSTEQ